MFFEPHTGMELVTGEGVVLGTLLIEGWEPRHLFAQFTPAPAYAGVAPLFREFEECANQQCFSFLDDLDAAIEKLGLRLRAADGRETTPIHDVQIMNQDRDFSCAPPVMETNGVPSARREPAPARE